MPFEKPLRAVIYARLSSSTVESVSIERQLEACRQYAAARGWEVVDAFQDDGVSGLKVKALDRPGFQPIKELLGNFDVLLTWKLDRVGRNATDILNLEESLTGYGAHLATTDGTIDFTTPTGRLIGIILAAVAEMEATNTAERIRAARRFLAYAGRWAAGRTLWPLETVPNPDGPGKVLRPSARRTEALRGVVERLLSGSTLHGECRWLDEHGFTPAKGETWNPASLKRLLLNPTLVGAQIYHGEPIRGEDGLMVIDPERVVIDRDTWERLRTHLTRMDQGSRPPDVEPRWLAGLLFCSGCNRKLYRRESGPHKTYWCNRRDCPGRVSIAWKAAEDAYVELWLEAVGSVHLGPPRQEVNGPDLVEIDRLASELQAVEAALRDAEDDEAGLSLLRSRKALRSALKAAEDGYSSTQAFQVAPHDPHEPTLREAWAATTSDEEREQLVREKGLPAKVLPSRKQARRLPARDRIVMLLD